MNLIQKPPKYREKLLGELYHGPRTTKQLRKVVQGWTLSRLALVLGEMERDGLVVSRRSGEGWTWEVKHD